MTASEILKDLAKIMKAEKIRKSPSNMYITLEGNMHLEDDHPELDSLVIAAYAIDLDEYPIFKKAYDAEYGKRKKSSKPAAITEVYVGDLLEETEKAYGFFSGKMLSAFKPYIIWVPKSQVSYDEKSSTLTMPVWLAVEKNWMKAN